MEGTKAKNEVGLDGIIEAPPSEANVARYTGHANSINAMCVIDDAKEAGENLKTCYSAPPSLPPCQRLRSHAPRFPLSACTVGLVTPYASPPLLLTRALLTGHPGCAGARWWT